MSTSESNSSYSLSSYCGWLSSWVSASRRTFSEARDASLLAIIHRHITELSRLRDAELLAASRQLWDGSKVNVLSDDLLSRSFALYSEAVRREYGFQLFDVQFLGGLSTLRREIAEMKTGEGKTFVGGLASYSIALRGNGVHFMTTNAYLAERDYTLVSPLLRRLGMSLGLISREQDPASKKAAYRCDVTYGPGYEFGFDYLRDQLAIQSGKLNTTNVQAQDGVNNEEKQNPSLIQTKHYAAIIDEADSVLIDEATTPLVLSGSADRPSLTPEPYRAADSLVKTLIEGNDYILDRKKHTANLTGHGLVKVNDQVGTDVRVGLRRPWVQYVENALKAQFFLLRDQQYIVRDAKIMLVDGNTGRVFDDRTWSSGLHQAVEAKESLTITEENASLATVSRQQYFQLYEHLCGMTGTASEAKSELKAVYRLSVTPIAPYRACQRIVYPLRCFSTSEAKWKAIADSIREIHETQRPILVGTPTIEASELIASRLTGLDFSLLNGKQDADEAAMIAMAGNRKAITIATNMAGRGTDIRLGTGVADLGGLHVIVTEPNDSTRVDRQLVGRASRQGDTGSCQTFLAADDRIIVEHAGWLARHIKRMADSRGEVNENLQSELLKIQARIERSDATHRQHMFSRQRWQEDAKAILAKS